MSKNSASMLLVNTQSQLNFLEISTDSMDLGIQYCCGFQAITATVMTVSSSS